MKSKLLLITIILISCSTKPKKDHSVLELTEADVKIAAIQWFKGLYISRIDTIDGKRLPVMIMSIREDFTGTSYFDSNLSYDNIVTWKIPQGDFTWSPDLFDPKSGMTITCTWSNGETTQLGYMQKKEYVNPLLSTMLWTPGSDNDGVIYRRKIGYKVTEKFMKELQPEKTTNSIDN